MTQDDEKKLVSDAALLDAVRLLGEIETSAREEEQARALKRRLEDQFNSLPDEVFEAANSFAEKHQWNIARAIIELRQRKKDSKP